MVRILQQNYLTYSYEIILLFIRDSYVLFFVVCCKILLSASMLLMIFIRKFFVIFYIVTLKHPNSDKCTIITAIKDTYL